jgi:hypothetical protein
VPRCVELGAHFGGHPHVQFQRVHHCVRIGNRHGSLMTHLEIKIVVTQLNKLSSVSGGSIYAGVLASLWDALSRNPTLETYQRLVVDPLRQFCRQDRPMEFSGQIL